MLIHLRVEFVQRGRLPMQVAAHDLVLRLSYILTTEGRLTSQHLIQYTSETVDIGAVIDLLRLNLLRTHILWRPDIRPEPGITLLAHHQSNAEINEIGILI